MRCSHVGIPDSFFLVACHSGSTGRRHERAAGAEPRSVAATASGRGAWGTLDQRGCASAEGTTVCRDAPWGCWRRCRPGQGMARAWIGRLRCRRGAWHMQLPPHCTFLPLQDKHTLPDIVKVRVSVACCLRVRLTSLRQSVAGGARGQNAGFSAFGARMLRC